MKRLIYWMFSLISILCMVGCSSSEPEDMADLLDQSQVKYDIQEYISEVLDESAEIILCEIQSKELVDRDAYISAAVSYGNDSTETRGMFYLEYGLDDKDWILNKCRIELGDVVLSEDGESQATEVPQAPEEELVFSRGIIEGQVYTNAFAGISYTAPEGFTYLDDSQIATIFSAAKEQTGTAETDSVVYDAYCMDEAGNNISINYENLNSVYGKVLDAASYLQLSESGLKTTLENVENVSINDMTITTTDIAGVQMDCLHADLLMNGTNVYETIIVKKVGEYMAILTATSTSKEGVQAILSGLVNY